MTVPGLHRCIDRAPALTRELRFLALEHHQVQHRVHQRYVDGLSLSGPLAMNQGSLDGAEGVGAGEYIRDEYAC